MRVAMIGPERRDCGIGDFTRELVAHLRERVTVVPWPSERIGDGDPAAIDAGVVHLQYEHAFFLADDDPAGNVDRFFSRLRLPTLVTLHCQPLEDRRWTRWLSAPGFVFHVQSGVHAAALRRMEPDVRLIETPTPIGARVPARETPEGLRSRLGLGDRPVVAMFGFVKPHKGYDVALDALERLPDDVVLLVAGGGQSADEEAFIRDLHAAARERGLADRFRVTGYLDPDLVGAALGAADVVLAPFHTVTASASVATAMAWERPVVGSALPQMLELEARFGIPLCVPPGDPVRLADAVGGLLTERAARDRLAAAARRARVECGYDRVADACLSAYAGLAESPSEVAR